MIEDQDVRRISHNVLNNPLGVAVVRGDILVANSTPTMARKAAGAENTALTSDGTDPSYTKISTAMITPGSNGDMMVTTGGAAAWAAQSSIITAPGLVFISSQTASASATIDFTSGISATYDQYRVSITDVTPATDNVEIWLRVSQSASFLSGASDYGHSRIQNSTGGTPGGFGSAGDAKIVIANALGNGSGKTFSGEVQFFLPTGTARFKQFMWQVTLASALTTVINNSGAGCLILNTSAIDGIRFLMSSGNISTGTFALYGVRKS